MKITKEIQIYAKRAKNMTQISAIFKNNCHFGFLRG